MYFLFSYGASLQAVFETSMIGLTPLLTSSRTAQIQLIYIYILCLVYQKWIKMVILYSYIDYIAHIYDDMIYTI